MPFLSRLNHFSRETPERTAVRVGSRQLSYAELAERVSFRAAELQGRAYTVVDSANSLELIVELAAAMNGEGRCAVLDAALPAATAATVRANLVGHWGPETPGLPAESADADVVHREGRRTAQLHDGDPDSTFLLALTSGTTSLPKALTRTRRSWQASFEVSVPAFGLREEDVTLVPGPLSAGLGLYALAESLHAGATIHALTSVDIGAALDAIEFDGVTRLVVVPALLRLLAERGFAAGADGSLIRSIVVAGAKLDARTLEAVRRWAPEAVIHEYFGAQELSFVAFRTLDAASEEDSPSAVGSPFSNVELRILSPEGAVAKEGEPGLISVRSPMVSDGYLWGDDGHGLEEMDGWATVGDEGYLRDGVLHFLGRRADMITNAGANVYPQEVEAALASLPGVDAAVVTGVDDPLRGSHLVAGIRTSFAGVGSGQLRMGLASVLERHKLPQEYVELVELPLTSQGKLSRALLRDWLAVNDPRARRMQP